MRSKHSAIVLAITSGLYWLLIQQIRTKQAFFEKLLPASILMVIFSYAVYKMFIFSLNTLVDKCDFMKKLMLGNEYIHGNWIGYYIGESGNIRYFHEEINQTFDEILIRGMAHDENGNVISRWNSESVNLNGKLGKLVYTYITEGKENDQDGTGIVKYTFSTRNSFGINVLEGHYTDLQYGKRRESYAKRIKVKEVTKAIILDEARKFYELSRKI